MRHFLRTGEKDASAAESWQQLPSNDVPAGIDNIGNTCYLNSVLQYFFLDHEVRNRVLQAASTLTESADADSFPSMKIEEWVASVSLRASCNAAGGSLLNWVPLPHLIHANALSVRPERELAYLALVSSRAEELEGEFSQGTGRKRSHPNRTVQATLHSRPQSLPTLHRSRPPRPSLSPQLS